MGDWTVKIAEMLVRILGKYSENQKKPRRYGLEDKLYRAEIHLIMLIGKHPDYGVTELASRSGVTKGAVSQLSQRLVNKGLVKRDPDSKDRKRVAFSLTNKGKVAFYSHERYHEESDGELIRFLRGLTREELGIIEQFLSLLERGIDRRSET